MKNLVKKSAKANGGANHGTVTNAQGAGVEAQLQRVLARVPPFIALPRPSDRCAYTRKSRTGLGELIIPSKRNNFDPPVKAIYLKSHQDAQRGQWLIPAENLFRYLFGLAEDSAATYIKTAEVRSRAKVRK